MPKKTEINSNKRKNRIFKIFAILLPFFLFILVETVLRLFSYGTNMNLFVEHNNENYKDYYMVNPHVGEKYFNRFEANTSTNDIFLKQKPNNGFRIFVMGSSTIIGFPYDRNLMASRILHKRLEDAYPHKTIEIVNTSITAINSITLKDYIDQILNYAPDAILFYAGHNEFYGAFGVGSNENMSENSFLQTMHFEFSNLRLYQVLRTVIYWVSEQVANKSDTSASKGTLMKRIVNDKNIIYNGEKYKKGIQQYINNLSYILNQAKHEGIPLFLSDLVSNIKDLPPFGDVTDKKHSAVMKYREAVRTLSDGDTLLAKKLFYEAKDLDPIRFRASEEINQIIYDQAEQDQAILVPTKEWFSHHSSGGLMGDNLFTEHVHPNIDGQFILADAFYTKIVESNLIDEAPNPLTERNKEFYRHNWGYTTLDSLVGVYVVEQLKSYWPFTSLDNSITFRDTFKTTGLVDSLAFIFITNTDSRIDSLHNYLGKYYENNNQWNLASKEYEALIAINPYRSDYYNKAANSLLKLSDLYAAENYLKRSVQFVETYFAYSILGEIEFIKHNFNGAIDALKMALELTEVEDIDDEDKIIILKKMYKVYELNKDVDNQIKVKKELSELGYNDTIPSVNPKFEYSKYIPFNIKQPFNKALNHYSNNADSALYYLNSCLEINDCPLVNFTIGNLLYQKKDKKVLDYYEKAYSAYKKVPNFLARLCVAHIVNKDNDKAKNVLKELIEYYPSYPEISRLKELVNK